ncbi:MAG: hypothetical protein JXL97_12070 [Bacteroidales bacterium]|nr:hypothetical protein [Bacteroidales bacterium]
MKKLVVITFSLVLILSSCSNQVEKNIIGTWTVKETDFQNIDEVMDIFINDYALDQAGADEIRKEILKSLEDEMKGTIIVFEEDNIYKAEGNEGKWYYNKKSKAFEIEEGGYEYDLSIEKFKGDVIELIMTVEDDGIKMDISMKLFRN